MSVYSDVYNALLGLGYPVSKASELNPNKTMPDTYIVYQIIDSPTAFVADNKPIGKIPRMQVTGWSKQESIREDFADSETGIDAVMLAIGWTRVNGMDRTDGEYKGWLSDYKKYYSIGG